MNRVGLWLRSLFYVPSTERTYRRNLSVLLGCEAVWGCGLAFVAPPVINALLLQLTDFPNACRLGVSRPRRLFACLDTRRHAE